MDLFHKACRFFLEMNASFPSEAAALQFASIFLFCGLPIIVIAEEQ